MTFLNLSAKIFGAYCNRLCGESCVQPFASICGSKHVDIINAIKWTDTSNVVTIPSVTKSKCGVFSSYCNSTSAT